jgi:hypothetical protein
MFELSLSSHILAAFAPLFCEGFKEPSLLITYYEQFELTDPFQASLHPLLKELMTSIASYYYLNSFFLDI